MLAPTGQRWCSLMRRTGSRRRTWLRLLARTAERKSAGWQDHGTLRANTTGGLLDAGQVNDMRHELVGIGWDRRGHIKLAQV